ncbi:T9SS type B sorting domain-containing protein [Flavobacterium aciduliphilum]|uniref:Gliding motility-associated-like protein n=1 Tax=Flavobacterium aciduliphilum TaxID=1101402 RepID=A0A328YEZ9_9FLAO|nr:T9SS type B sorting domain-containing protein [Flavobacterium aciduliphilum]RAR70602.1 gliding motility-associated-like protein [Flavobacterium aciduliphilum]
MKNTILKIALFTLLSMNCFAQFSKTHYIPPLSNSDAQEPQGQYIYISCPSVTPVNFQIQEIGGNVISGVVSRDTPYVYSVGAGFDTQLLISRSDVNTIKHNKGYIIQAQDLVYVNVRLTSTPQNYQAGGIVSKGSAALGTKFRIGGFVNTSVPSTTNNHYTFASILATENNTTISFGDIKTGVQLINNTAAGNTPSNITLNAGDSFIIAVEGPTNANRDGLIGASITSDKPIAVNCGSFAGSDGDTTNLDLGMDQIVSAERTGSEYIFIKGSGVDVTERPILIANEDNTVIYLNGNTTPVTTLNSGQYLALTGADFSSNNNLYVKSSKNIFAFQGIGGSSSQANQNMHFVPPLSCQTPKSINNIPLINEVGDLTDFEGTVCIVTKTGATLDFIIDGVSYTFATLPSSLSVTGPLTVTGNPDFVTYTIQGLTGNVSVFSSQQVYLSYYGSSGAATYGGFYSGFTFKPEIVFQTGASSTADCLPNVNLTVNSISNFDVYQWYLNGNPIAGATSNSYTPLVPGYYKVKASLTDCGIDFFSDEIPVSSCPPDTDSDGINDNIDADIDNDGLTNCTESYGNQIISLTNTASGSISAGSTNYTFTGQITTSTNSSTTPFSGFSDGSFITDLPAGKGNWVKYALTFSNALSLKMEYVTTANTTDLIDSNGEFIINAPINKTITVLNPNNQLLIDTNYDGIYESGITQYSSFEIRFRLNSTTPLAAGSGTFQFLTNGSNTFSMTHKNLSDSSIDKATFKISATCIAKDSDNDGIPDQNDYDSDNDGIPDLVESQGLNFFPLLNVDSNQDGIDNVFGTGITAVDSDHDGIPDYLDLDSDNDGIYDLVESNSNATDTNNDGIVDGTSFGTNGLADSLETSADSGQLNYTLADTDGDTANNYIDLDSDGDGCNDVIEAGFLDPNNDGLLGSIAPPTVNPKGVVTSGVGYTTPNANYIIGAPIIIINQPQDQITCELQSATFTISTNSIDSYQWQLSTDGGTTWTNVLNNALYSGATTSTLNISSVSPSMSGTKFRVLLNKVGNSCGQTSAVATLTTFALPVLNIITLKQCDDDTDGIANFNLTVNNALISANSTTETFTYFTSAIGANTNDVSQQITNPFVYSSSNGTVWVRVENNNHCYSITQIHLIVSVTQLPISFVIPNQYKCDDYVDAINNQYDGVSSFDLSAIYTSVQNQLTPPYSNYSINFYKILNDFNAEIDTNGNSLAITNITNYRNIGYPNQQTIWVKVNSSIDNTCFGYKTFSLIVEPTPVFHSVGINDEVHHCDDDQDGTYGFDTSTLVSTILQGQTNVSVTFYDAGIPITLPNPFFVTNTKTITVRLTNNPSLASDGPCYYEKDIHFVVDTLPQVFASSLSFVACDDETNPIYQNGIYPFNTTGVESTLLGTQTGMALSFTMQDGTILQHLPNPFNSINQNVTATVTNPLNTTCPVTATLPFVVHPLPLVNLNTNGLDDTLICSNTTNSYVTINAGVLNSTLINNYTYQWYLDGVLLPGKTTYAISVNTGGLYTVVVTNTFGCSETRKIKVNTSVIANINSIIVSDFSENNTVSIIVTGNGDYVYSLDDAYGPYQTSNTFENVPMGIYTAYVKDLNGCGIAEETFSVLGAPKFFTPNGDGYHDTWNLVGITANYLPNTTIRIYDRYGKLIKQLAALGAGWDGTYNGILAPSDDYWYQASLQDGRIIKGHFSLKR